MSKEVMRQALEALENSVDLVREDAYQAEKLYGNYPTRQGKVNGLKVLADDHEKAITALREALAEHPAQQEPVAYLVDGDLYYPEEIDWESLQEQGHTVASLYTQAQRTWVGLTDEEIIDMWAESSPYYHEDDFARAIEAKLKEKNNG